VTTWRPAVALVVTVALLSSWRALPDPVPDIVHNDNRSPAGQIGGDSLYIALVVTQGIWRPEAADGPSATVAAFAEEGKAPQIPAPLIRVREGTTIVASIRNALPDSTVILHGLETRPAAGNDSLAIRPGETRTVRFEAGRPGTYYYWADRGRQSPDVEDEQLAGALIVDPREGSPPDRVFVINIWGEPVDSARFRNAVAINGKSWPHTEPFQLTVGDSLRWRWVNASIRNHPMHLHGFYYRVDAKGNARVDTAFAPDARRLVVTEDLRAGQTMTMAWEPSRPGNWLFHCHISFHVIHEARLDPPAGHVHSSDPRQHMAGLVLGMEVTPRRGDPVEQRDHPRRLRLLVQEGRPHGRAPRSLGFVLQSGPTPPAPDSVEIPGSLLVLTRDQPTDITVVNRLNEATAVHWHGIELESFSDGVAGWSRTEGRTAPPIAPGDSFTARLTLPRAGTFIYHTHLNDIEQITSGLYGPIVVLEPGARFDPATDHVVVVGWDGEGANEDPRIINGGRSPSPLTLEAGVRHRFRLINIGPADRTRIAMLRDSTPVTWRAIAKDGADLPASQATRRLAVALVAVGETYDFEFVPESPGEYRLVAGDPVKPFFVQRVMVVGR
jgi:FtsP/CotA-like multicopper oxidase with cupredoxin domain